MELERIIKKHQSVADVSVVGVPIDKMREAPRAYVVPKPGTVINTNQLQQFVAGMFLWHPEHHCSYNASNHIFHLYACFSVSLQLFGIF